MSAALWLSALAACGSPADPPAPVLNSLVVSITYDTMRVGEAARATAEGRDQAGAPMRLADVSWTTSDAAVATVSHVGYVTAVGLGSARIAAAALGRSAEITVHVMRTPVAGVLLGPSSSVLAPGETLRLVASAIDAAGRPLVDRKISWLSSDTSVVSVSDDGLITAVNPGVTSVSAISETVYASATVRVSGPAGPVAKITLTPSAASLSIGQTRQLITTLEDAEGDLATGRLVVWTSSAPNVATVSPDGVVLAVAPGTAAIEATSEGQRATASIVVVDPLDAIIIRAADPEVNEIVGDTLRIYASASSRNRIVTVHATAFNRETQLDSIPVGFQGLGTAWVGSLYAGDIRYGPYQLVITAVDDKGNQGILTVPFTRGTREGKGGTALPPRNK